MSTNYRQPAFYVLLAVLLGLLSACASSPPTSEVDFKQGHNFSGIKTVAFIKPSVSGNSSKALLSDMDVNRINDALADALELKGLTVVMDAAKADALVSWHLAAQDQTDVHTYNTAGARGGYGMYNRAALYNCWSCGSTQVSVSRYTEGTFIVDIIDPGLNQSVWRSVTQSRLKGKLKKDPGAINEAAQRILAAFPP